MDSLKILFTPYGGGSIAHTVRSLAVADELKRRGHKILFTAPTSRKSFIEKAGYEVFGKGHADVNLNDENDQGISYFRSHRAQFLDWLGDEIRAAETFKPDIIVNSPTFFGPLASLKLGIPHVSIINAQWLMEFKGLLGLGRSTDSFLNQMIRRAAKPIFAKKFDDLYMAEIKSFYEDLGVGYIPMKRVDLHRHNPILIPSVPEFEPIEKTVRTNIHYVGPLFWGGFEDKPFDPKQTFANYGKRPFVYVSLGGSIYRKKSYQELLEALNSKKDWLILVSIGPNFAADEFKSQGPHLVIQPYSPGLAVCQAADIVINTASHGTVMQALWHGKPLVTIPHNIDQGTIAGRIAELGLGVNLNRVSLRDFSNREKYFEKATQIPWSKVIEAAELALADSAMQRRAEKFKQHLRDYQHGDQKAADFIEKYAQKNS